MVFAAGFLENVELKLILEQWWFQVQPPLFQVLFPFQVRYVTFLGHICLLGGLWIHHLGFWRNPINHQCLILEWRKSSPKQFHHTSAATFKKCMDQYVRSFPTGYTTWKSDGTTPMQLLFYHGTLLIHLLGVAMPPSTFTTNNSGL